LRGFSLSSCPQHRMKVLLLLNAIVFLKYVLNCEHNSSFFVFRSGLTVTGLASVCCTYILPLVICEMSNMISPP
jgi:hypothetical protein